MGKLDPRSLMRAIGLGVMAGMILAACAPAASTPTTAPAAPPAAQPAATTAPAQPAATTAAKPAATTAAAPTARKLSFLFPNNAATGTFYAFYAARDLGFWQEDGLEVEFVGSGGSGAAVQQLIAGQVDAGIPSMPATLNALSQGQKLQGMYQYSTGTLFFLKVPTDGDVKEIKDLKGKVIGISEAGGGEVPMIKAALKGAGLDPESDVRLIPIGEGSPATFQAIKSGQVHAYSSNFQDTLSIELAGIPLTDITPKEFDAFPAQMVIATPDSIQKNQEAFTIFLRGLAKATYYCQNKQDVCEEITKNAAKEQWADPRVGKAQYDNAIKMTTPKNPDRLGEPDKGSLENYLAFQKEEDPQFNPPKVEDFLATTMLDGANNFDRDATLKAEYKP